jgi:AraC-like DNA-binding protein
MFRKYALTNYKTYLDGIRLEHAVELLERTDQSIGEIALQCGFPNSKAFSRAFKEKYGMLPSGFRRGEGCE